ncbi:MULTISPECIES: hypothetical protein [Bradyrhizobium]|jgi:hypothetical protein|uniref:hypothetical protein n=1 Tax=Bradyrhizobium TaxID=374 RepID=UPI000462562B|nr:MULTISPECIES: hypothetical protein [Bradyrhizobium]KQT20437.1 hypothetical protein ASG57_28380 [Bradyrhizobium sp. Leaf396]
MFLNQKRAMRLHSTLAHLRATHPTDQQLVDGVIRAFSCDLLKQRATQLSQSASTANPLAAALADIVTRCHVINYIVVLNDRRVIALENRIANAITASDLAPSALEIANAVAQALECYLDARIAGMVDGPA